MRIAFFRNFAGAGVCVLLTATTAPAQNPASDSSAYSVQKLDSTQIRGLPLSRDAEVTSFLPRTWLRFGYDAQVRGAIGGSDVRVDGVPVSNLSVGGSFLELPAQVHQSVVVYANGTPVSFDRPTAFEYFTTSAGTEWTGRARVRSDAALPGSIGGFRSDANVGGGIGSTRLNFAISAQSAQSTEFNNVGDVTFYEAAGADTTLTFTDFDDATRTVTVPRFAERDNQDLVPGTNWNQLLASGRFDFLRNARTQAYATVHFSRLQELQFPGLHIFNMQSQVADRSTSALTSLALEHAFNTSTRLSVRLARGSDEVTHGVLTEAGARSMQTARAGLQFGSLDFLIDDDDYRIDDERVEQWITNVFTTPVNPNQTDLGMRSEFRFNPYATIGFTTSGFAPTDYEFLSEHRWFGAASVQHQLGQHSLTLGAEATHSPTRFISIPYYETISTELWVEAPTHLRAFAQDRLRIGAGIIEGGIRIDWYNSGAQYPETPGFTVAEEYFAAPSSAVLSPRLAFAFPFDQVTIRAFAGAGAHVPRFYEQFAGMHKDIFRYGRENTSAVFSRPLDLVKQTYFGGEGSVALSPRWSVAASFLRAQSGNDITTRKLAFDDPTNPGSVQYLNVTTHGGEVTNTAVDFVTSYQMPQRTAWLAVSRIRNKNLITTMTSTPAGPAVIQFEEPTSHTSVVGAFTMAGPAAGPLHDLEFTASVRASSPIDEFAFVDGRFEKVDENPWNVRLDTRLAKPVRFGGMRGKVWVDALRLAGTSVYAEPTVQDFQVTVHRQILGAGGVNDHMSLRSLEEAGGGVRNEVELHMLRRAEARFGNGDLVFTAEEQTAAFSESVRYQSIANVQRNQSRRVVVGLEVGF